MLTTLPLVGLVPTDWPLPPVDGEDVARRLCAIVRAGPSGHLPEMGGPRVSTGGELARTWLRRRGMRRAIIPLWRPGKMTRALRCGSNTHPQQAAGTVSWDARLQRPSGSAVEGSERHVGLSVH